MSNPWFRMYSEFSHDPKVQMMSEAMQRRYMMLMCLRCSNSLVTLHETEIAFHLRISNEEMAETKALFIAKGFIDKDFNLINWEKRQFASDTSKARVAKHRALQKEKQSAGGNGNVTLLKRNDNALDTDTDTDTELEAKASLSPVSEKTHEVAAKPKPAKQKADGFVLPEWINPDHWAAWRSHPKLKNATPEQKQIAVEKLAKWREAGDNFAGALENAAASGYQGLFLPDTRAGNSAGAGVTSQVETNYQRSMRERYEEATGSKRNTSIDVIDITSNTLEITA